LGDRPSIVNIAVPDFSAEMTGGRPFRLEDYRGKKLVIYFYPKDNTPGCTTEAMQFRDLPARRSSASAATACARMTASSPSWACLLS